MHDVKIDLVCEPHCVKLFFVDLASPAVWSFDIIDWVNVISEYISEYVFTE